MRAVLGDAHVSAYDFPYHATDWRIKSFCRGIVAAPIILLKDGFEAYVEEAGRRSPHANMSGKPYQTLKRMANVERKYGPIRFTWHEVSSRALSQLFAWKSAQYNRTGTVLSPIDCFTFTWTRHLLERIHATQTPGFAGVLSTLYIGDNLVAVHMGMRSEKRCCTGGSPPMIRRSAGLRPV